MSARGDRCIRCRLQTPRCICEHIPQVGAQTPLLVLRHRKERLRVSNSVHLAHLAIPALRIHDIEAVRGMALPEGLIAPGAWLVFPEPGPDAPPDVRPEQLVFLDGNWRQARRLYQRLPALYGLPRLRLPPPPPRDRLRTPPKPELMSTLEAIAASLAMVEDTALADPLYAFFDRAVIAARLEKGDARGVNAGDGAEPSAPAPSER